MQNHLGVDHSKVLACLSSSEENQKSSIARVGEGGWGRRGGGGWEMGSGKGVLELNI